MIDCLTSMIPMERDPVDELLDQELLRDYLDLLGDEQDLSMVCMPDHLLQMPEVVKDAPSFGMTNPLPLQQERTVSFDLFGDVVDRALDQTTQVIHDVNNCLANLERPDDGLESEPSSVSVASEEKPVETPSSPSPDQHQEILVRLGSVRYSKHEPFVDAADLQDPGAPANSRGGHHNFFPDKLHEVLEYLEAEGKESVAGFLPHGRAFAIRDIERFRTEVLPRFFTYKEFSTFTRQLHLYGFLRQRSGTDSGAYYHSLFLRNRPNLARYMRRVGLPKGGDRRKTRGQDRAEDPNFYAMKPVY